MYDSVVAERLLNPWLGPSTNDFMEIMFGTTEYTLAVTAEKDVEVVIGEDEKQALVEKLISIYPRINTNAANDILKGASWNFELARDRYKTILDGIARAELVSSAGSDECDDPSFPDLCFKYSHISKALVAYALRKTSFVREEAEYYLRLPAMTQIIARELAELIGENSKMQAELDKLVEKSQTSTPLMEQQTLPGRQVAIPFPQKQLEQKRKPTTLTIDLHEHTVGEAVAKVKYILGKLEPHIKKVNFITGRGNHSKNNVPLVRPAVFQVIGDLGYQTEVMEKNPGIVSVFIDEVSGFGHRQPVIEKSKKTGLTLKIGC